MKNRIKRICVFMCLLALVGTMTACRNDNMSLILDNNNAENNDMEGTREDPSEYEDLTVGGASLKFYCGENITVLEYCGEEVNSFFNDISKEHSGDIQLSFELNHEYTLDVLSLADSRNTVRTSYMNETEGKCGGNEHNYFTYNDFEVDYSRNENHLFIWVKGENYKIASSTELPYVQVTYASEFIDNGWEEFFIPADKISYTTDVPEEFKNNQYISQNIFSTSDFPLLSAVSPATDDYFLAALDDNYEESCDLLSFDQEGNIVQSISLFLVDDETAENIRQTGDESYFGTSNPNVFYYDTSDEADGSKFQIMKEFTINDDWQGGSMLYMSKPYMTLMNYTNMNK